MAGLQWRIAVVVVVLAAAAFLLYPSVGPVPTFWEEHLPHNPIRLGLDLQGGLHLVLKVQGKEAVKTKVDQAMSEAGDLMKEAKIGYTDIYRTSDISFAAVLRNPAQAVLFDTKVLERLGDFKKEPSAATEKGYEVRLKLLPKVMEEIEKQAVVQAVDTIRNRVDQLGVAEPDVIVHGEDEIVVQLPGLKEDVEEAKRVIKQTARLEFKLVVSSGPDAEAAEKKGIGADEEILYHKEASRQTGATIQTPYLLKKLVLMTGEVVTDARIRPDQLGGMVISLTLNRRGARIFDRITSEHVGQRLAIVLDKTVQSAPVIRTRIPDGMAQIEGNFTAQEAKELATVLKSGSLPAPVKVINELMVGPSLGMDSIRLGRNAVILGMLLVAVCMAVYYKWSGVVADVALFLNLVLILAVMALMRATLTLPGLAGVALTIGMAIDANVLVFERIREEVRKGKSPAAALDLGYSRAFWTIFDSNLTTILAALPLIQFGTGPIKGFGVTLCIGLIISMFTALFVTRVIFDYAFQNLRISRISV